MYTWIKNYSWVDLILRPNKGVRLATLWKWGFLGPRNGLLKQFFLFISGFSRDFYKTPFLPAAFSFVEKIQKPGACFKEGKQTIMIWTNFITLFDLQFLFSIKLGFGRGSLFFLATKKQTIMIRNSSKDIILWK